MIKLAIPFILLLLAVGVAVISDSPPPPADFTYSSSSEPTTLDLQRMSWMHDLRAGRILFEGLIHNDPFTDAFDIIPGVAESWTLSEDGRTYTFSLRRDAAWSNGQPVTASDFVFAWRRALLPDSASDYSATFFLIEGAEEFFNWRADALETFGHADRAKAETLWAETENRFNDTVAIRALDDHTFQVRLNAPTPYFLDLAALPFYFPVYPPLVSQYEILQDTGRLKIESGWTKPPRLVSNGPFVLTSWRFKRGMRMEKNPWYWNADAVAIDSIAIPTIEDPNAAILSFNTGALDWLTDVGPAYKADMLAAKREFYRENQAEYDRLKAEGWDPFEIDRRLPDDPRKNIHAFPAFATYWYNFNCLPNLPDGRVNPFHDARVRRAFAMMMDKRSIVEDVRRLGEPVARTVIPPNSIGGYAAPNGLDCISDAATDAERQVMIDQARALLAEAGYPDPSNFPTVEIMFNKDSGHDLIAQVVAKNWSTNLGVPTRLAQKETKVYREDLKNGNYMVSRAGWYGDYGYPTTFLDVNRTGDGNNDRQYSNPVYDDLLARAGTEIDPDARLRMLERAEQILVEEDLPLVPIYHYVTIYLFDPDEISGISPHPRDSQDVFLVDVLGDGKGPDTPRTMPRHPIPPRPGGGGVSRVRETDGGGEKVARP
jgi:oligopeptide transport system substrate-binding protein